MPQQWFFLVIVGIVAGVFSGMFGIGGGVVIVPTLAIFLGLTTTSAIATSLAALLMPVGILAVSAYYRAKLFDVRAAALIAFGLLITSALGALGALALDNINPALLRQVYGLFLLVMGWRFAEPRKFWRASLASVQKIFFLHQKLVSFRSATIMVKLGRSTETFSAQRMTQLQVR